MPPAAPVWIAMPHSSGTVVDAKGRAIPQPPRDQRLEHPSIQTLAANTPAFAITRHPVTRFCAAYAHLRKAKKSVPRDINAFVADIWAYMHLPQFIPQHRFVHTAHSGKACACLPLEKPARWQASLRPWGYTHHPPPEPDIARAQLSKTSLRILSEIYYRDFRLFKYPLPVTTSPMLDVLRAVADVAHPPALIFYSRNFANVYRRWRAHHAAYSTRRVVAVYLKQPDESQGREALTWDKPQRLEAFWQTRLTQFCLLMLNGLDFVHFDADAFVLRPYDHFVSRLRAPFLFSLGEGHPRNVYQSLGVTGCCGFFAVHAAHIPPAWLGMLMRANTEDDQRSFNELFLHEHAYLLANTARHSHMPRRLRFLRADNYEDARQRRRVHLARYGARAFDKRHQPIVEFLPTRIVARARQGFWWRGKTIWHIKIFYYKTATKTDVQWQAIKRARPLWYLWLRQWGLRVFTRVSQLQWRGGTPSQ